MKITAIICGRPHGESSRMARTALKAAKEAGADDLQIINLMQLKINPCIDCKNCVRRLTDPDYDRPCPLNDDMQWLDCRYLESDAVIFVAPMYENCVPGPYKTFCDRLGPSHDVTFQKFSYDNQLARGRTPNIDPRFFIVRPVIYITHGGSEWNYLGYPSVAIPSVSLGLNCVAYVSIPWAATWRTDGRIEKIREAARHLVKQTILPDAERTFLGDPGICPVCHSRTMVLHDNADELTCALCGTIGTLRVENGKVKALYSPEAIALSHVLEGGRRQHMEDLRKNGAILAGINKEEEQIFTKKLEDEFPYLIP